MLKGGTDSVQIYLVVIDVRFVSVSISYLHWNDKTKQIKSKRDETRQNKTKQMNVYETRLVHWVVKFVLQLLSEYLSICRFIIVILRFRLIVTSHPRFTMCRAFVRFGRYEMNGNLHATKICLVFAVSFPHHTMLYSQRRGFELIFPLFITWNTIIYVEQRSERGSKRERERER